MCTGITQYVLRSVVDREKFPWFGQLHIFLEIGAFWRYLAGAPLNGVIPRRAELNYRKSHFLFPESAWEKKLDLEGEGCRHKLSDHPPTAIIRAASDDQRVTPRVFDGHIEIACCASGGGS